MSERLLPDCSPATGEKRPWAALLRAGAIAFLLLVAVLPPLHLTVGGRGGAVFALEPLVMITALIIFWREGFRLRSCASLKALALYLGVSVLSTLHATDLPRHFYGLMQFTVAGLLLYALTAVRPRRVVLDTLIRLSPLPFVALSVLVITAAVSGDLLAGPEKVVIAHGSSNFLASMLLLGVFVPLAVALSGDARRRDRVLALAALALIAVGIGVTSSRAAMAMGLVGFVVTLLVIRPRGRRGWMRLGTVVAILAIVLSVSLGSHFASLARAGRFRAPLAQWSFVARIALFDLYERQFLAHPWIGNGHLNGRATPALALLGEGNAHSSQGVVWGAHVYAHNWLLQSLADTGIIGGVAFVVFLVAALRTFAAGVRRRHPWTPISAGLFAGFIAVLLHGLFEPNFHGKPFIYLFVIQLGLAEQIRSAGKLVPGPCLARALRGPLTVRGYPALRPHAGVRGARAGAARF